MNTLNDFDSLEYVKLINNGVNIADRYNNLVTKGVLTPEEEYEKNKLYNLLVQKRNFDIHKGEIIVSLNAFVSNNRGYKDLKVGNSVTTITDFKEINDSNVIDVINKIKSISNISSSKREEVEEDIERQKLFFDTKLMIARKLILDLATKLSCEIVSGTKNYSLNSMEFFKEHGFIVECQRDTTSGRGNDLLVVYNPKFGETFSIHMQDMDPMLADNFKNMVSSYNLCCTNCEGLTEAKKFEIEVNTNLPNIVEGFTNKKDNIPENDSYNYLLEASFRLKNFFKFDCMIIKENIGRYSAQEILDFIPITNPDKVYFEGDTESILDKYLRIIGYSYTSSSTSTINDSSSELESMLESDTIDVVSEIEDNNSSHK